MKNKKLSGIKRDLGIIIHFLKLSSKISKTYVPVAVLSSIFKAIAPFINIIMPKFIIDELLEKQRIEVFIKLVAVTIIANAVLNLINRWIDTVMDVKKLELVNGFDLLVGEKIMNMDFEKIEDPEILDLKEKAIFPIRNQGIMWGMMNSITIAISEFFTIIGLIAIISTLNVIIIFVIIGIVVLNSFIYKKSQKTEYEFFEEVIPINRKFGYYGELTSDFSMGKDIRLYNIRPLIMNRIEGFHEASVNIFNKLGRLKGKYEGLNRVNLQIQMMVVYAYMTYKVVINSIGIGDFTMYINAANNFSNSISEFLKAYIDITQSCRYLDLYMQFEGIESHKSNGSKKIEKISDCTIEFRNVSFKYPRSEKYTLKNISITINSKEKLSVVGLNGAGKTTFIKLLTKLYEPTKGEILLNGVNINEYNYEDYMKLLSVVFQDFKLMAFSVKENVALENYKAVKDEDMLKVLKKCGMEQDILKLPNGMHTSIYKTFDKEGIEFSGGQSQKLAIARALYKDGPIVVLDEPTEALDPIAEFEIYSKFNELIGDKIAIYISHRLSSCKFCDKIAVFQNGEIIQYGTHDELVKEKGKQYEAMYMAQAQYYV